MKLPLETVLRRGHVQALQRASDQQTAATQRSILPTTEPPAPSSRSAPFAGDLRTVVPVGPFRGVLGTMWYIVREEGSSVRPVAAIKAQAQAGLAVRDKSKGIRKGQGVAGLWRGWRVGFWGLVGVWGASALGGGGVGGEF